MTQIYSDPDREKEHHSLPDIEVFYISRIEAEKNRQELYEHESDDCVGLTSEGWYWWSCFPGCLPDSEPEGPFDTEEDAIVDSRDMD